MGPVPARTQVGRFIRMILPATVILVVAVVAGFGVLVYRITHPGSVEEPVNPSQYLLPSVDVVWPDGDGAEVTAWWIPGLKGAPAVLLVPGLSMSKSDALSLALPLHNEGFHLLVYESRGSGEARRGASSLGLREADDMLAALRFMSSQVGVDTKSLGIWGVDVEARAALQAAASVPEVRAIVADGAYENLLDFVVVRVREDLGLENRFLEFGCRQMFKLVHLRSVSLLNKDLAVNALSDRSILFIQGENRRGLGSLTEAVYRRVQPQKELAVLKAARIHLMSGAELGDYDRRVTTFFHENLPNAAPAERHL